MTSKRFKICIGICILSICTLSQAMVPELGDEDCESLILVSNWNNDNVKIYDGCSGQFVRDLDSQNLIDGPLGILQAPNGDVLVVSETNNRLLRWDFQTLSSGSELMGNGPATSAFIGGPSGAIIDNDGFMYAASFTQNIVVKIDTNNWQIVEEMLSSSNGLISGIDAGLTINNGNLYLPGFNSDNVIKLNLSSKQASVAISQSTGGLDAPRSVIVNSNNLWVAAERTNAVLSFNLSNGNFIQTLLQITAPTGIQKDGDQHFIMSTLNSIYRVSNDGSTSQQIIQNGAGGLNSGTFVYRLYKTGFDSDQDGLTNEDETDIYGTDPNDPDTDDDNLTDGDEVNVYQTNPLLVDTDSDGMPDDFEVNFGLAATQDDAAGDLDNDGLTNIEEYLAGTLPNNDDTDGDGEKDGDDTDPLVPNSAPELSGTPETSVDQDANYQFSPALSYAGDLTTVSLAIDNKPSWIDFNASTGELTGQPTNSDVGFDENISITATNGFHIVALDSFNIEVVNINDAPTLLQAIPSQTLMVDQNISLDVTTFFGDIDISDSLSFSATGLPAGVTISTNGVVSGSSSTTSNSVVKITATDNGNATAVGSFNLLIQALSVEENSSGGGSTNLLIIALLLLVRNKRR